jgi:TRAP-type C4-dicarboxylate transport system permease small subunit
LDQPTTITMPHTLLRIRLLSRWVRAICLLGALCLICIPAYIWSQPEWVARTAASQWGLAEHNIHLALKNRLLGAAASMVPVAAGLYVLWQMWSLFGAYGQGRIFTADSVRRLRLLALGMLSLALAQPVSVALISIALTMDNSSGQRAVVLNLSSQDYLALLFGLVMLAIASVMAEARRVAEENAEFI